MSVCLSVFLCVSLRCLFLCSAVPVWVPWYIYLSKVSGCLCVSVGLSVRGVSLCVFPSARPFLLPPNISPLFHTLTTGGYFRPVMVRGIVQRGIHVSQLKSFTLGGNNWLGCHRLRHQFSKAANVHKGWMQCWKNRGKPNFETFLRWCIVVKVMQPNWRPQGTCSVLPSSRQYSFRQKRLQRKYRSQYV